MDDALSTLSRKLADPSRMRLLCILVDGRAFTGKELASYAGIAASTASEHLAQLRDAGLVRARKNGRSVYHSLTGPEVARALEGLSPLLPPAKAPHPLGLARCCYDHLAGKLGVAIADGLVQTAVLADDGGTLVKGVGYHAGLDHLGLALPPRRAPLRCCLDWTERRTHVGGGLGAAILAQALDQGWVARSATPRLLHITPLGQAAFFERYSVVPG